jgi:hypothetical protein
MRTRFLRFQWIDSPIGGDRSERLLRVEPCRSHVVLRTAAIGASRPLRRIPAIVSFVNPQPALSLLGGNHSPSGLYAG